MIFVQQRKPIITIDLDKSEWKVIEGDSSCQEATQKSQDSSSIMTPTSNESLIVESVGAN